MHIKTKTHTEILQKVGSTIDQQQQKRRLRTDGILSHRGGGGGA